MNKDNITFKIGSLVSKDYRLSSVHYSTFMFGDNREAISLPIDEQCALSVGKKYIVKISEKDNYTRYVIANKSLQKSIRRNRSIVVAVFTDFCDFLGDKGMDVVKAIVLLFALKGMFFFISRLGRGVL